MSTGYSNILPTNTRIGGADFMMGDKVFSVLVSFLVLILRLIETAQHLSGNKLVMRSSFNVELQLILIEFVSCCTWQRKIIKCWKYKMTGHNLNTSFIFYCLSLLHSKLGPRSTGNISNLIPFQVASSSQSFNEDRLFLVLLNL